MNKSTLSKLKASFLKQGGGNSSSETGENVKNMCFHL